MGPERTEAEAKRDGVVKNEAKTRKAAEKWARKLAAHDAEQIKRARLAALNRQMRRGGGARDERVSGLGSSGRGGRGPRPG